MPGTHRRGFAVLLIVLALLLAACGGEADDTGDTGSADPTATTASQQPLTAPPPPSEATSVGSSDAGSDVRTIEHALGETTIEGTPERIVVLEWPYVEALLAIGVQPVGVADIAGYTELVNTDPSLADGVTDVGTRQEPSLESIAALEPDLIIGMKTRHTELYPTLSDIAPTLVFDPFPEDGEQLQRMEATVLTIAQALGRPDAGQAAIDALHAAMDAAAEQLARAGHAGRTFVLAQALAGEETQLRLFQDNATVVQILEGIGLENAWEGEFQQIGFSTVGLEALASVEQADFFYVPYVGAELYGGNPVWDNLTFVREDRIYDLSGAWVLAGPLSGQAFVEKVVDALLDDSVTVGTTPAGTRTVQHALGELEIEGTPQRIVVLEWTYAEDLLALGVQPVGVADVAGYSTWVNVDPALDESVTDVGTRQEPSLESITALEPDLIIGVQFRHEPIYDQLSAIAPTLLFNPYPTDEATTQLDEMEQTLLAIATAIDREDAGQTVLREMHAAFDEARTQLDAAGAVGAEFILVQAFTSQDSPQMRVFIDSSMAVQILGQIGLENAWDGEFDQYGFNTVGVEALVDVEQANLFYVVQSDDNPFENQWKDNPVWNKLAFVAEDRTYPLGGDTWLFGGPLSAQLVVDKVVAALAE